MFSNEDINAIRKIILEAGAKIMEIYDSADMEVDSKSDDSPVTNADLAADKVISEGLKARFPDETLITEEQAQSHDVSADRFFIIDPLDGTKEFIKRRGEFTVNIAYVDNGKPIFGMVYAPALGRLFFTDDNAAYHEQDPSTDTVKNTTETVFEGYGQRKSLYRRLEIAS